jgi:CheY-like chemotaxis protein
LSSDADTPKRVLFVEDAFDQALLVKAFLGAAGGFQVTHSQDGDHALLLLDSEEWDIIITDLNLPGTDGFKIIKRGRAKQADLPILATTGYTDAQYTEQALSSGANQVLIKPLDKDKFLAMVSSLLGEGPVSAVETSPVEAAEKSPVRDAGTSPILAVGGLAGDVEMGCGGSLMLAAATGRRVVVVPVCRIDASDADAVRVATKKASKQMGLQAVVGKALDTTERRTALLEKAINDLRPSAMYIPAMDDSHPERMEAFGVSQSFSVAVDTVLVYQTATSGLDFRPTHFVDIAEQMPTKLKALSAFKDSGRKDLTAEMAHAYAHYWGRYHEFSEVEAFEIIKGKP